MNINIPPSKSHTLRAILFAALASGKSEIKNPLRSPDTTSMIDAVTLMGAKVSDQNDSIFIDGVGGGLSHFKGVVDAGNSGIVLRFVGAIAALTKGPVALTGDDSILTSRPIIPLISGLEQLGATCSYLGEKDHPPILISGGKLSGKARIDGADSQPVSGLLIAAALSQDPVVIEVENPGEKPWMDLTCYWLDLLGGKYSREGYTKFSFEERSTFSSFSYLVPGDWSSAGIVIGMSIIARCPLTLIGLDIQDPQGDKAILSHFEAMGTRFSWEGDNLTVHPSEEISPINADIGDIVDALPILASVLACANGKSRLSGCAICRLKESDRIHAMHMELAKMGIKTFEFPDGIDIIGGHPKGAEVNSHGDHRIAMALAALGLISDGEAIIQHPSVVNKTFPHFFTELDRIKRNASQTPHSPVRPHV